MYFKYKRIIYLTIIVLFIGLLIQISLEIARPMSREQVKDGPPIYIIVFDEMATEVLFDADKNMDRENFPNFNSLQESSYWFRDATAVATETQFALPAIMTGRYPELHDVRMKYEHYPENVCTILWQVGYSINATESVSTLCSRAAGAKVSREPWLISRVELAVRQMFRDKKEERDHKFLNWVAESKADRNNLNFIHVILPHEIYQYLPDGKKYTDYDYFEFSESDIHGVWESEYLAATAYQQYVWQVQYTDKLLGELLKKLEKEGNYDQALIVVTADHGVTYRMGANRRWPILRENLGVQDEESNDSVFLDDSAVIDLVKVPLFIKLPEQSEGYIIDEVATNMDVLPTLLKHLGVEAGHSMDGLDLFSQRPESEHLYTLLGRTHQDRSNLGEIKHKLRITDGKYDHTEIKSRLDAGRSWGVKTSWDNVIGEDVKSVKLVDIDADIRIDDGNLYEDVDMSSGFIPVMLTGSIQFKTETDRQLVLGVAVNGVYRAITLAYGDGKNNNFIAMLEQSSLRDGRNDIQVDPLGWTGEEVH